MLIQAVKSSEDLLKCWEAYQVLRPHLTIEKYMTLFEEMQKEGYQIIFIEKDEKAAAVLGFRYMTMFYAGKFIYIDDLGTLPNYRGNGFGGQLLDYVINLAKQQKLDGIHLDTGHQRFDAHRLYLNKGFRINSHHLQLVINQENGQF